MKIRHLPEAVFFASLLLLSAPALSEVSVEKGKEFFVTHRCVRCHSIGRGRFVGPDLYGVFRKYTRDEVLRWISNPLAVYELKGRSPVNEGYPPMPSSGVTVRDAEMIADYLASLQDSKPPGTAGKISGKVINKTKDAPASGVEVRLDTFLGDRPLSNRLLKTGADGGFVFENLSFTAAHRVSIARGGVFYETDKMVFNPEQSAMSLTLPVFETTSDDTALSLELNHLIVRVLPDGVSVIEFLEFRNSGLSALVSGSAGVRGATLRFGIPPGAAGVNFAHGVEREGVRSGDEGVFYTRPVLPGARRVVLSYIVPFEESFLGDKKARFEKRLEYTTSSFIVISDVPGTLEVEGLGAPETVSAPDGRVFRRWSETGLEPRSKIVLSARSASRATPPWLLPASAFLIVLVCGFLYARLFGRRA